MRKYLASHLPSSCTRGLSRGRKQRSRRPDSQSPATRQLTRRQMGWARHRSSPGSSAHQHRSGSAPRSHPLHQSGQTLSLYSITLLNCLIMFIELVIFYPE